MTEQNLQDRLVEEIKSLFKYKRYKKAFAEADERMEVSVYPQNLPMKFQLEDEEEPELTLAPYIIVRIMEGETGNSESGDSVEIYIIMCIYDDDETNQGYRDILEMIGTIKRRFQREPMLGNQYIYNEEKGLHWTLSDEDVYPFYFAGISISFEIPRIRKEDNYS